MKEKILESMDALALPKKEISRIGEFYNKSASRQVLKSGNAILERLNYESISKQSHEMLASILSRKTMTPLLILSTLFFIQSWSGAIVVFFFGVSIFQVCLIMFSNINIWGTYWNPFSKSYNIILTFMSRRLEYLLMHTMQLSSLALSKCLEVVLELLSLTKQEESFYW